MMKIAHIKKNLQEKHHLKISSIRSEDDLSYEKHGEKFQIPQLDGAQYANISSPQKSSNQRKQPETTTAYENYPVTP